MKVAGICLCCYTLVLAFGCNTKASFPTPEVLPVGKPVDTRDTTGVDTLKSGYSGIDSSYKALSHYCQSERFDTVDLYTVEQLGTKSGTYTTSLNYQSQPQVLRYEFVAPANDTLARRPFILMVHEGAFLFGDLSNEVGKARCMAQKGYAATSINYRLGFEGGSQINACGGTTREVVKALYRAVQDTRSALSYFVSNSDRFGIDPQQIYLAGSSAGSMTIIALNYMNESDFEKLVPGIVQELGPLDRTGKADYTIRGLLSYMGLAITNKNLITAANAKPTLMFQGELDTVLPYNSGSLYGCYLTTYGSMSVKQRLQELNQPFEWIVQQGGNHVISYSTDFITNRYAGFIKRIWCNDLRQVSRINTTVTQDINITGPVSQK